MEHVVPIRVYLRIYAALMALLALTVAVAYAHVWSPLAIFVMLAVAITKAVLVMLYFMGLRWGTRLTWLWAGIGFVFLLLLFGVVMDQTTRGWIALPAGWE